MREIIQEGRDTTEAIDLACAKLGVDRADVQIEVINVAKRGFLGLKNTPARVRVYLEEEETPAPKKPAEPTPKREQPRPQGIVRQEKPAEPQKPRFEKAAESVKAPEKPCEVRAENKPEVPSPAQELHFVPMSTLMGKAKTAADYLDSVLREMGVTAQIAAAENPGSVVLRLTGDGLGVIIGRRGETLDALQYLSSLVANREEGDYLRVTIDSGNYREKRERTLQQLAKKISATTIRYARSSTLEPMNPYERRIIHATISEIEGVTSSSIGEEPNRRVVISPLNARPQGGPRGNGGLKGRSMNGKSGGSRPPFRKEGAPAPRDGGRERFGDRPPRRDDRGSRPDDRSPRPMRRPDAAPVAKATSTDLDRTYAQELVKNPALGKSPANAPQVQPSAAPVREKALEEGKDLPLYGKIDV